MFTFNDGEQLIGFMASTDRSPDLIFLDINMPRMNGIECLRILKAQYPQPGTRVVMLSTASAPQVIELSFRGGADLYIQKPGKFSDLKKYLRYCVYNLKEQAGRPTFILNDLLNKP